MAIVRLRPIQGNIVHAHLRRRNAQEQINYLPELERVLGRTLGVFLLREQVMELAILAADYTLGKADQLRRSMAA